MNEDSVVVAPASAAATATGMRAAGEGSTRAGMATAGVRAYPGVSGAAPAPRPVAVAGILDSIARRLGPAEESA